MQLIPQRPLALVPLAARIVVAEPLHKVISQWLEPLDHQGLAQGNPDVVHNEPSKCEVTDDQITDHFGGTRALPQPLAERMGFGRSIQLGTLPLTGRDGLADIDQPCRLRRVQAHQRSVGGEGALAGTIQLGGK